MFRFCHNPRSAAIGRAAAGIAGVAVLALSACSPGFTNYQSGSRLGQVRLYAPTDARAAVVFLFSDASGWNDEMGGAAAALAQRGTVVVGVDLHAYLGRLGASDDGCHYLISEIEELSKRKNPQMTQMTQIGIEEEPARAVNSSHQVGGGTRQRLV